MDSAALLTLVERLLRDEDKARDIEFACKHTVARDRLTGLRRGEELELMIDEEVRRANRYGYAVSIVFVDADDLGLFNNTEGYDAGDELIKKLADLLYAKIRDTDHIARWYDAGDEFVIVMPETLHRRALTAMRRIQRLGDQSDLRFSFGIQDYSGSEDTEGQVDGGTLIKQAAKRMQNQKKRRKRAEC